MKRLILCLLALCCLILCACADQPKAKAELPAPEALAAELLASGAFSEDLALAENEVGCFLYALEESDAPGMRYYFSSGAVADEIAILPCADEAGAQQAMSECRGRLDNLITLYKQYKPEEVPKLDKAVILQRGNTVVFCAAADADKAKAVLDKYF